MSKLKILISSVQNEFAEERKQLSQHFKTDALLSMFFEPVLFEELPAASQAPDQVYLDAVRESQVYLFLLGQEYDQENQNGISLTEQTYEYAKAHNSDILAFIKGDNQVNCQGHENSLIENVQKNFSYKRFWDISQLIGEVDAALVALLKRKGFIQQTSFDESLHPTAQLGDLDAGKIEKFVGLAISKRGLPIGQGASIEKVLTQLHLLQGEKICNSALLVFAKEPQRFFPTAIIQYGHFDGFKVGDAISDHKVFQGDLFEQIDQAVDFVLSKISLSVGVRSISSQASVRYEIPPAVVAEAIVNAIVHRDYNSHGSVRISLFSDRLEIYNPGRLTPELSILKLKTGHGSYPVNPRLTELMYLAGYMERFGIGTEEVVRLTQEAKLNEPQFALEEGFKVVLWRPSATIGQATGQVGGQVIGQGAGQVSGQADEQVPEGIRQALHVIFGEMKSADIQSALQLKHRETFRDNYLNPAMAEGYVEMTIPGKPNSPNQRYRLTQKGLELKAKLEKS